MAKDLTQTFEDIEEHNQIMEKPTEKKFKKRVRTRDRLNANLVDEEDEPPIFKPRNLATRNRSRIAKKEDSEPVEKSIQSNASSNKGSIRTRSQIQRALKLENYN